MLAYLLHFILLCYLIYYTLYFYVILLNALIGGAINEPDMAQLKRMFLFISKAELYDCFNGEEGKHRVKALISYLDCMRMLPPRVATGAPDDPIDVDNLNAGADLSDDSDDEVMQVSKIYYLYITLVYKYILLIFRNIC